MKSVTKASVSNTWDTKSQLEKNNNPTIPTTGPTDKERETQKDKTKTEKKKESQSEMKEDKHNKIREEMKKYKVNTSQLLGKIKAEETKEKKIEDKGGKDKMIGDKTGKGRATAEILI